MKELTYETFATWLLENASEKMLAHLCDMMDDAGDKATAMVTANPTEGPYLVELVADSFYYKLRDALESRFGVAVSSDHDDAGVYTYYASVGDDNPTDGSVPAPRISGESEMQALAAWLRTCTFAD